MKQITPDRASVAVAAIILDGVSSIRLNQESMRIKGQRINLSGSPRRSPRKRWGGTCAGWRRRPVESRTLCKTRRPVHWRHPRLRISSAYDDMAGGELCSIQHLLVRLGWFVDHGHKGGCLLPGQHPPRLGLNDPFGPFGHRLKNEGRDGDTAHSCRILDFLSQSGGESRVDPFGRGTWWPPTFSHCRFLNRFHALMLPDKDPVPQLIFWCHGGTTRIYGFSDTI